MSRTVVTLRSVAKGFTRDGRTLPVLDGIDVDFKAGEVVIVRGRSGSGKTTLLNLLAGWQEPDAGEVSWGVPRPNDWQSVAVVPQTLGLLPELTLGENILLPDRLRPGDHGFHARDLAQRLGIIHLLERRMEEASLGEQQRAAVCRALVLRPQVILADEPSCHQDTRNLEAVWTQFRRAAAGGSAVIASTHDPDAFPFGDRILDLRGGRLVAA